MPKRRARDIPQLRLQALTHDEAFEYPAPPPFASTSQEIRLAAEQNARERGILLIRVMVSLQVDSILEAVDTLAKAYDLEDYHQAAEEANIAPAASFIHESAARLGGARRYYLSNRPGSALTG